MLRASIDLGTNTCLLLIADWDEKSRVVSRIVGDFTTLVRLGEGVDRNRELQPAAMERTWDCLKQYAIKLKSMGLAPGEAICVATSQARDAKNSSEFFGKIKTDTGFVFRTLSGIEEARYTFQGALLPGMDPSKSWVIDIGGGSTEIISEGRDESVDMGSVRFTERYLKSDPVTDEEFWKCQEAIDQGLKHFAERHIQKDAQLVAVAGTATTLAAWHLGLSQFDSTQIDSAVLRRGDVHRMVEELKWRTIQERKTLPGMEPLRADVLLAGSLILWRAMELLNFSECRVSTRGLRFGILQI